MADITYNDKSQSAAYDPAEWNAQDANEVKNSVNSKVDKITGKGLSSEDYTSVEKTKLSGIEAGATANQSNAYLLNRSNHTGTQNADTIVDGTTNKVFTLTDKTKLAGIATGATANSTDAQLRDRSTHTGFQAISTVTNLQNTLNSKQDVLVSAVNIKTINGNSLLGSGDLVISGGGGSITSVNGDTGPTVVLDADDISDTSTTKKFTTAAQISKLAGIATGATANQADAFLLARANHTGTQAPSTIVQDSSNRFVTDAEKSNWSAKSDDADIEAAFEANKLYFSNATFEGENVASPTPSDPPIGSIDNPIIVKNNGIVVADIIQDGNMNPITSNAVFDGMATKISVPDPGDTLSSSLLPAFYFDDDDFSGTGTSLDKIRFTRPINTVVESGSINPVSSGAVYTAIDDLRTYLLELITSGLVTPEAPTAFVVDDDANTADFTYSTGYTDITDYEYQINGGSITAATVKPINIGDVEAAIGAIKIRVKAVPGVSNASPWLTNPDPYTPSGGEYIVERRISLDLQGQYGNTIEGDIVTWNTWKANSDDLLVDGSAIFTGVVTETNEATTIGVVNIGSWNGSAANTGDATGTRPYPLDAINGGFNFTDNVGLKLTGLNPSKYYQIYVLAANSEANAAMDITIQGTTINVVSTGNYPTGTTAARYTNTQIAKFYNKVPNGSGDITISFAKTGSLYQVTTSLILIEESNIAKP